MRVARSNWSEQLTAGIPTLSLFTGAGGLDIGFHNAGFDIRACVEIEPSYAKTLDHNASKRRHFNEGVKVFCQDVTKFDPIPFEDAGTLLANSFSLGITLTSH